MEEVVGVKNITYFTMLNKFAKDKMKQEEKDVWVFGTEKRNLICYTPESIRHPAKMSLHLCREIIKRYSKPGDLILDCMAGIGSTIVEGMILNRNVIGVEYEQKFVSMAEQNIKKVNRSMGFMNSLGKGFVIKGDSRKLSEVLSKADIPDSIIFSPPFANSNQGGGIAKRMINDKKNDKDTYGGTNQAQPLSKDKDNIDNIKDYGKIDSVIFSPPYGHGSTHTKGQEQTKWRKENKYYVGHDKETHYSDNPDNVGNKKGKDYLSEMLIIYKECLKVLRPSGYMVLVLKNFVRKGEQIRLDLDTIKLVEAAGFTYVTRHYRKINNPSFWITNAIHKWEKKFPGKTHPYPLMEDVLVFRKEEK